MNTAELESKVKAMFAHAYRLPDASGLTRDTDIKKELSAKSLDMVGFIAILEKELDVEIRMQEAVTIKTVGEMIDRIAAALE